MAESLRCSPRTTTMLLITYTPIQNVFGIKKIKIKKLMFTRGPMREEIVFILLTVVSSKMPSI